MRLRIIVVAFLALAAMPAAAATIPAGAPMFDGGVIVTNGSDGVAQVHDVGGNRLGLVGLRWAAVGDVIDRSLFQSFTTATILNIYAGADTQYLGGMLAEFDDISTGAQVSGVARESDGRIFSAVWVEWAGTENIVFSTRRPNGSTATATLSGNVTRAGNPLPSAVAPVPLPAPLWMLLVGIAGLVAFGRRRGAGVRAA
jgi:hypothetical protein